MLKASNSQTKCAMPHSPATLGLEIVVILSTVASEVAMVKGHIRSGDIFVSFGNSKQLAALAEITKWHWNHKPVKKSQKFCYWGVW